MDVRWCGRGEGVYVCLRAYMRIYQHIHAFVYAYICAMHYGYFNLMCLVLNIIYVFTIYSRTKAHWLMLFVDYTRL